MARSAHLSLESCPSEHPLATRRHPSPPSDHATVRVAVHGGHWNVHLTPLGLPDSRGSLHVT
eukprot:1137607-Pelagomonas_calceolata.AAC.3